MSYTNIINYIQDCKYIDLNKDNSINSIKYCINESNNGYNNNIINEIYNNKSYTGLCLNNYTNILNTTMNQRVVNQESDIFDYYK